MAIKLWTLPGMLVLSAIGALHTLTLASGIPAGLEMTDLAIETSAGARHHFEVALARSPEERARGLMNVTRLDPDQGMLFDAGFETRASMWMKNTPLSLDMLFIRGDGSIVRIVSETMPYSRVPIDSAEPVRGVLELLGGTCQSLGIVPGDKVLHPVFEPASAPQDDQPAAHVEQAP